MASSSNVVAEPAKKMGKFVFPEGFPVDRQKVLNQAVHHAIIALSTVRRKGCNEAAALGKKTAAIRARQAEVDEFLRQKTVQEVNDHTSKEVTRAIAETREEGAKTRGNFQQLLRGNLPSTDEAMDPREELQAIKAAKVLMRSREESLRALVKAEEGPKPAKRQKTESPAAVPEVSASQLKLAEAFVKRHEKEDLRLCGSQYIGQYIHRVPEHSLKALQKTLKDYWTLLAELRPRCGNESYILQRYLADHWSAFQWTQEGPSKSPSSVISEFTRLVRGPVVACKEEVS